MKNKFLFLFLAGLFFWFSEICTAQEVLVAIDEQGKIELIDSQLEKKLNLFQEYENFKEARLFKVSDSAYVLEISCEKEKKLTRTRLPLNAREVEELRKKVTERIQTKSPEAALDQEGRTKLISGSLSLSLGFYGWALPAALKVNDGKLIVGLYMLTGAAGFYVPFSVTKNRPVSEAATTLYLYGGTRGIWHGFALAGMFSDHFSRGYFSAGMGLSLAEAIIGFNLANAYKMSTGTAEVITVGGDFGLGLGLGTSVLLESEKVSYNANILLGSGLGLVAGKLLADRQPYTRGDALVLQGSGALGAFIPLAVVDMFNTKNEKTYVAASMFGSVVGLGIGQKLVQGKDFSTGQGLLVELSELAGGLLGLGFAYLVTPEGEENSTFFLTSSAAGATGGFWLMYAIYAPKAQKATKAGAWNINIRPEGLLSFTMGGKINAELQRRLRLVSVQYRF